MGGGEQEIKIEREQEDVVKGLVTFWHRLSMVYNREEVKGILGRGIMIKLCFPNMKVGAMCTIYVEKVRHKTQGT